MLDAMSGVPAFVRNGRLDILAANRLGRALYPGHFDSPHQPVNSARFVFLDLGPSASTSTGSTSRATSSLSFARRPVEIRTTASCPISSACYRPGATPSASCGRRTTCGDTTPRPSDPPPGRGRPQPHERVDGAAADPGLTMFVYTAEPGSRSEEADSACSGAGRRPPTRRRCMQITRNGIDTTLGPSDWFTGAAYIDPVATPSDASRLSASSVHFTARGAHCVAHPPERPDDLRPRRRRPRTAPRRRDRRDPCRRPGVLRAGRGARARCGADPLHDPPGDAPGRRRGEQRCVGDHVTDEEVHGSARELTPFPARGPRSGLSCGHGGRSPQPRRRLVSSMRESLPKHHASGPTTSSK